MVIEKSVLILREDMLKYLMFQLLILKQFRKIMDVHMREADRGWKAGKKSTGEHILVKGIKRCILLSFQFPRLNIYL